MVTEKKVRTVIEDAVVGKECTYAERMYCKGYDKFQFPLTVSFDAEGRYEVVIEGKKAIIKRVEDVVQNGMKAVVSEKYTSYRCPKCDKVVYPSEHYCSQCGQKLDWRIYDSEGNIND